VQDLAQQLRHVLRRHLLEVELQAAAEHGDRDLLRVGGGEDELDVLGRLLERLEHRVERVRREHVHFVDHVDLEARVARRVDGAFQQRGHLVDAAVAGGIHLDVVDEAAGIDGGAGLALIARGGGDAAGAVGAGAVQRLGKDARQRRLADAPRPGEQVRMVQALLLQRVREGAHHVLLPHAGGELTRAPLARQNLIRHGGGV
jgi:hypothetical protein